MEKEVTNPDNCPKCQYWQLPWINHHISCDINIAVENYWIICKAQAFRYTTVYGVSVCYDFNMV